MVESYGGSISMEIGDFVWRKGCVCRIVRKMTSSVELEEMELVDDLTASGVSFTYADAQSCRLLL